MKKTVVLILILSLIVSMACLFIACKDDKEAVIKNYEPIEVENYAIGDKYNQSDAGIVAVLEDGTKKDITENLIFVGEDNLKLDDDGNFTEAGEYKVKVYALEEREDMYIGEWTIKVS